MKKITLLFLLCTFFAHAQPTTDPVVPPSRNASDVISIYGGSNGGNPYTNITGINYTPFWNQPAPYIAPNPSVDTGSGNLVLFYDELSYQGTDFTGNAQNASSMEFLHVDIWTPDGQTINVSPINNGAGGSGATEFQVGIPTSAGSWTSVDIPKSSFTGMTWNAVGQFIFVRPGYGSPTPRADVYLDNIYFWKAPADPAKDATLSDLKIEGNTVIGFSPEIINYTYEVPQGTVVVPQITSVTTTQMGATPSITQASSIPGNATVLVTSSDMSTTKTYTVSIVALGPPSAAPTPPARNASDVKSIFSNAYTNVTTFDYDNTDGAIDTYNTFWCPGNTELILVDGNETNKITGLGCEGVDFQSGRFDATSFTHFHMDIYTDTPTLDKSFNIILSQWGGTSSQVSTVQYSLTNASSPVALPNPNPGTWISLDIPLANFTGAGSRNDIVQFVVASDLGTVYYDNLYLYKGAPLSADDYEITEFSVYPNPTQDSWNVKTQGESINAIQVFDILGKNVLSLSPNSYEATIDGSLLKSGLYFAQISTLKGTSSIKLVKQ